MLNTIERRHDIVQATLELGKVTVEELSEKYGVSTVTIRSDLKILDQKELLVRTRGGAMASSPLGHELSIPEKTRKKNTTKQTLGRMAASLVEEGNKIILDSGTTTAEIAYGLRDFNRLVVMTNGLNVAQNLVDAEGVELLMTGGTLRRKSMSFYGRQAEEALYRLHFDKVFLGADGFDFQAGLTTHFEYEAILNRIMCEVSSEIIAVTDSTKFGKHGVHKIRPFDAINTLITDNGIPDAYAQSLENNGVRLIVCN